MAWYKIADRPLTIVNSPIIATIEIDGGETQDIECSASEWQDKSRNMADSGHVYWYQGGGGGTKASPLANQFDIYVLDEAVLNGYNTSWDSSTPMSGIFVSENVRGITIPPSTIYHKVPVEYIENNKYIVTVSSDGNGGYQADHQFSDIYEAFNAGKSIFVNYEEGFISLTDIYPSNSSAEFSLMYLSYGTIDFNGSTYEGDYMEHLTINITEDMVYVDETPIPCGSFSSNGGGALE